ncbi:MAG: Rrf2 family transcriptional regulator [Bacteroidota bacterium]
MLSKKAQYSFSALVYLAKNREKGPILISEIADNENLPKKFLEAILLDLKKIGILGSRKGKGGGYYLIKDPEEINFADVIRKFDGALALLPCVTYNYYEKCDHCKDESTCGMRSVVKDIRDKTVDILKKTTIADILNREEELSGKESK